MKAIVNESVVYNGSIYKANDIMFVDDAVGTSLIKRGVITAFEDIEEEAVEEFIEEETFKGHLDKEDLETWSFDELKKLATDMGLSVPRKKADLIEVICAETVEAPAEAIVTEEEAEEEIEELPNTSMPE